MPNIIFDESQNKQEENYPEKDNNIISIAIKNEFERI